MDVVLLRITTDVTLTARRAVRPKVTLGEPTARADSDTPGCVDTDTDRRPGCTHTRRQ